MQIKVTSPMFSVFTLILLLISINSYAANQILRVGPGQVYTKPSEAAKVAENGDIIEISAGIYNNDVAIWRADNLTLKGIGGKAHLKVSDGSNAEGKAIWVIKGDNVRVENIEFSGARVADNNGAGIRHEGINLVIHDCYFHHNEMGILTGTNAENEILISNSEFAYSGYGNGTSHNIYIGKIKKFTLIGSYSHHSLPGHTVKSRAQENFILYNRLMDGSDGRSSYLIDLPNGGYSYIVGNVLQQGARANNQNLISFASRNDTHPQQTLFVVNNTMVNDKKSGTFVHNHGDSDDIHLYNNLMVGAGLPLRGLGSLNNNVHTDAPGFVDRQAFDYHLTAESAAIDAAIDLGHLNDPLLIATEEYQHPQQLVSRIKFGSALDLGAYELFIDETGDRDPAQNDSVLEVNPPVNEEINNENIVEELLNNENSAAFLSLTGNGKRDLVKINRTNKLSIRISLNKSNLYSNTDLKPLSEIDMWIVAHNQGKWFTFDLKSKSWQDGLTTSYQGPLRNVRAYTLPVMSHLPVGKYQIFYAIDMEKDGIINDSLIYRKLFVNVSQ